MKLRREMGKYILTDESKTMIFDSVVVAMSYAFVMNALRGKPRTCAPPVHRPVRALTPNPKARALTLDERLRINRIKASIPRSII